MENERNKIGYARISTENQSADLQIDALKAAGCIRIFTDVASGKNTDRPQLQACLEYLQPGNILIVWKLDRLGRSLRDLISIVESLDERKIEFTSIQDAHIDTTTANGRLMFAVVGAFSAFERDLLRERTQAGLTAARARGRVGGRPNSLDAAQIKKLQTMYTGRELTVKQIAGRFGVSRATVYRHLTPTA